MSNTIFRDFLDHRVQISIKNRDEAKSLMDFLRNRGIVWASGATCSLESFPKYFDYEEETVEAREISSSKRILYGRRDRRLGIVTVSDVLREENEKFSLEIKKEKGGNIVVTWIENGEVIQKREFEYEKSMNLEQNIMTAFDDLYEDQ